MGYSPLLADSPGLRCTCGCSRTAGGRCSLLHLFLNSAGILGPGSQQSWCQHCATCRPIVLYSCTSVPKVPNQKCTYAGVRRTAYAAYGVQAVLGKPYYCTVYSTINQLNSEVCKSRRGRTLLRINTMQALKLCLFLALLVSSAHAKGTVHLPKPSSSSPYCTRLPTHTQIAVLVHLAANSDKSS